MSVRRLNCEIRGYAWGSREIIAGMQGRPTPSPATEAELWVGAHSDSPSIVDGAGPLDELIASAPIELLGADVVDRFGPRLPYLLKVLAAEQPLSLQAHPDAGQAAAGFAAEEASGALRLAGQRSYVDSHHKPELLVALTSFEALCGFRRPSEAAQTLAALAVPSLRQVVAALADGNMREAVRELLTWPAGDRASLIAQVVMAAGNLEPLAGDMVRDLGKLYPADMGVVVALLLNHLTLRPGQAIWMPAGNLHAYLHGSGVEIMAASDNVLRGGLTPKYVNVPELLNVLRFEPLEQPVLASREVAPGVVTWPVPVSDFRLHRVRPAAGTGTATLAPVGPRTVLCVAGEVTVADGAGSVELGGGEAAFGAAGDGPLTLTGTGEVYVASL